MIVRVTLAACACAMLAASALAQSSVEAFYKGRTVELVVGTLPGGGYDLYGRLVARYLSKHIPGQPTAIVRNMPGAGHLRMANWLYNVAPRDGPCSPPRRSRSRSSRRSAPTASNTTPASSPISAAPRPWSR